MRTLDFSLNRLLARSDSSAAPLRVGVVIDDGAVSQLACSVLKDIRAASFATLSQVISVTAITPDTTPRWSLRTLLYDFYTRWLDRARDREQDPSRRIDCRETLAGVSTVALNGLPDTAVDAQIGCERLDVIVSFSERVGADRFATLAQHGAWFFQFGDPGRHPHEAALLSEIIDANPLCTVDLVRIDTDHQRTSLNHGVLSCSKTLSVFEKRFEICWSAQHFVLQSLRALHLHGVAFLAGRSALDGKASAEVAGRSPGNLRVAHWLLPALGRAARDRVLRRDSRTHWRIALRNSATPLYDAPTDAALRDFKWQESPAGTYWADPCVIQHDGQSWVFFEQFSEVSGRAAIACGRIDAAGELADVRTVLERDHHLSYPQVFAHDGAVWMIPETRKTGTVDLYRAHRFPDEWKLERSLLDLRGIDPTPLYRDGRWWLFISPAIVSGNCAANWLFGASSLTGPWTLHPMNPVNNDVRFARGAGRIIATPDRLLRPSQDCSRVYGYSLTFNEITTLDESTYREAAGRPVLPHFRDDIHGIHTFSRAGDWEAIDGQYRLSRHDPGPRPA